MIALLMFACDAPSAADPADPEDTGRRTWTEVSYVDVGRVCITDGREGVEVRVEPPDCAYLYRTRDLSATCTATLDGTSLTVTSAISWTEGSGGGVDMCVDAWATCALAELPPGSYVVHLGENEFELDFPAEACGPFFGR
jgi:hypothetical protein